MCWHLTWATGHFISVLFQGYAGNHDACQCCVTSFNWCSLSNTNTNHRLPRCQYDTSKSFQCPTLAIARNFARAERSLQSIFYYHRQQGEPLSQFSPDFLNSKPRKDIWCDKTNRQDPGRVPSS